MNPVHAIPCYISIAHFNIIIPSTPNIGWKVGDSNSSKSKKCFCSPKRPHQGSYRMGNRVIPGGNAAVA